MNVRTISVKDLRNNFPNVRRNLNKGIAYLLIHRSKPIAEIKPFQETPSSQKFIEKLLNPPEEVQFKSNETSVNLIRKERN